MNLRKNLIWRLNVIWASYARSIQFVYPLGDGAFDKEEAGTQEIKIKKKAPGSVL